MARAAPVTHSATSSTRPTTLRSSSARDDGLLITSSRALTIVVPHLATDSHPQTAGSKMDNPQNNANDRERDLESGSAVTTDELQRRQRGSLPSFLFITFLFFMLTNRNEEDVVVRSQYEDALRAFGHQLSNFSAWLNGTATDFTLVRGSRFLRCLHVPNFSSPS